MEKQKQQKLREQTSFSTATTETIETTEPEERDMKSIVQQQVLKFQQLQQHFEQLTEYTQHLQQQHTEMELSKDTIRGYAETTGGRELLTPIVNGIFLQAKLQDTSTLFVNVGANTVVEKNVAEVLDLLREQQIQTINQLKEAEGILEQLHHQMKEVYHVVTNGN